MEDPSDTGMSKVDPTAEFAKKQTPRYLELDMQIRELLKAKEDLLNTLNNIDAIVADLDKQRTAEMR